MFDATDQLRRYNETIALTWHDEPFRRRLLANPLAVLRDRGLHIPEGTKQINVLQDTPDIKHFILLSRPTGKAHFTEEDVPEGFICC